MSPKINMILAGTMLIIVFICGLRGDYAQAAWLGTLAILTVLFVILKKLEDEDE